ncbi:hypothetical protein EVAR_31240_1 [Eumeta japonica]|uniref:Uncharacterized protein n=1 Tax=Eumeta variegata TaxID=151549 RepID=A0A4C1W2Q0_EUMVA|nr:hypothetical protein EVAR_31240_1 [Eumeta japonica]
MHNEVARGQLEYRISVKNIGRRSARDHEMNYLLNDFLLRSLEEDVDYEVIVELERALEHRCTFPLTFNLFGNLNINRGIIANLVQEPARYINHGYRYKEGAMGHAQVPQCPAPSERDGFGNVAKLLPPTSRVPLPLEYLYLWT